MHGLRKRCGSVSMEVMSIRGLSADKIGSSSSITRSWRMAILALVVTPGEGEPEENYFIGIHNT